MMGSREHTSEEEYDAFSRRIRRMLGWRRGELKRIKRRFSRRRRRALRQGIERHCRHLDA